MVVVTRSLPLALLLVLLAGCGERVYCQSGPKHGTKCYSEEDLAPEHRRDPHEN